MRKTVGPSRGFTLTEMLVVLGIILLVLSMILAGAMSTRRAARQTLCLSQLRNIALAVTNYSNRYDGAIPLGSWADVAPAAGYPTESPLSAGGFGTIKGDRDEMYGKGAGPLPTIRDMLQSFLGTKDQVWHCPFQPTAGGAVLLPFQGSGFSDDPRGFRPGYRFMSTLDMRAYFKTSDSAIYDMSAKLRAADLFVRNVGGLKFNRVRTLDRAAADHVVLAFDASTTYHSKEAREMYELRAGERPELKVNMAYLDGHAEERAFRGRDGFVAQLHGPVSQKWYGTEFEGTYDAFALPPKPE